MKKTIHLLLITCCIFSASSAFASHNNFGETLGERRYVPSQQYPNDFTQAKKNRRTTKEKKSGFFDSDVHELNFGVKTGYNTSELRWNIAGNSAGTSPNILSELKWENISGYKVEPKIEYTKKSGVLKGLNLQLSVNKSITFSGSNQDSDYSGDDRTGEFSRSNNSSDAGYSEGFSASIGYAFDFTDNRKKTIARFTTLVGYAMQNQKFVMRDGFQTIPANGAFANLRSSYSMEWKAPFIGMEFTGFYRDTHHLKIRAQYSRGSYYGTGNWNLRSDFMNPNSFEQDADGSGFLLGMEYGWEFYPQFQLTFSSNYNSFKTDAGNDRTFFTNGNIVDIQFNEAKWSSLDYMAGLNYSF